MYTKTLNIKGIGTVYVHHNSDWSGEATIALPIEDSPRYREVNVPGAILLEIGRAAVVNRMLNEIINFLEDEVCKRVFLETATDG